MEKITIFTPTYNRKDLLKRVYESLKRQTCKDFVWLVVDDGSTDDTKSQIESWALEEKSFRIQYVYKENGGLQSGYVEAIKHLETEFAMCLDSDDYLLDDAVEQILNFWDQEGNENLAGILALDQKEDGHIIGGLYPNDMKTVNLVDLSVGKVKRSESDRMLVIKTELYKKTKPAKKYDGEKTINATYLHLQIGLDYDFLVMNRPVCVVEYQDTGISKNKKKQYFSRPNNFADWRIFVLGFKDAPLKHYIGNNIHYIAECLIAKRNTIIKDSPRKFETILLIPIGVAYWLYLKKTVK